MDKIETVDIEFNGEVTQHIIITREDGSVISMPKSVYDTLPSNSADVAEAEKPKK